MLDVAKRSTYFIRSFIKIKSLTEDLFCTGEIETLDYCMEVYQQFINEEELDFFISDSQELKLALTKLREELLNFEFYLDKLLVTLHFFLAKKYKENLDKTKKIFLMDLQDQFKTLIKKNGKYSSGIYSKKGLFLERMKYTYIFDSVYFLKIEKKFIT